MTRAAAIRDAETQAGPRKARGHPAETRTRLVLAAAGEIEAHGYHATDTNRIARAAGYAPGTFYRHFPDKKAVFIAVYEEWVTREWSRIAAIVTGGRPGRKTVEAVVDAVIEHHRSWPRFRASLRALVALDPDVRRMHRRWRRRQLELLRGLTGRGGPAQALSLLVTERIADAVADGELEVLGVPFAAARAFLVDEIARAGAPAPVSRIRQGGRRARRARRPGR